MAVVMGVATGDMAAMVAMVAAMAATEATVATAEATIMADNQTPKTTLNVKELRW